MYIQSHNLHNCQNGGMLIINKTRFFRFSRKLGFSIGYDACDYGLVIPHYGTIVVGNTYRIGPYATLHTFTCITDTGRRIGKGLFLSTGAKITGGEVLGVISLLLPIWLSQSLSQKVMLCLSECLR